MAQLTARHRIICTFILLLAAGTLLSACTLGQQAPAEPIELTPGAGGLEPQEAPGQTGQVTQTPAIQVPSTNTPVPELQPTERLGPILVDTATKRVEEPTTLRVQAGTQVSNLSCTVVHQETNQTFPLGTPTQSAVDANTVVNVFTFTPQLAGTYSVNCTAVATTAAGQRAVSAVSDVFAVEAKG